MQSCCKCLAPPPQKAETRAAPTVGKIAIPATFSSPSAAELGTPRGSPRVSAKPTPRRNPSMEGRWNPTPYQAPPKDPLTSPQKSARGEPPAPDSARARAMKFEQLATASSPKLSEPPQPERAQSWWNPFAPAKPDKPDQARSKPEVVSTPRPDPEKPALVLWTNATSPRTSEAGVPSPGIPSPVKSPSKIRRNSFGTPVPPTPESALGKVKSYEELVQARKTVEPERVGKGWVGENGTYKKEHAPLPPKKELDELP